MASQTAQSETKYSEHRFIFSHDKPLLTCKHLEIDHFIYMKVYAYNNCFTVIHNYYSHCYIYYQSIKVTWTSSSKPSSPSTSRSKSTKPTTPLWHTAKCGRSTASLSQTSKGWGGTRCKTKTKRMVLASTLYSKLKKL